MEGMDVGLVNNFFGQPAYKAKFGVAGPNGVKAIPANWQTAINNGQQAGQIIGLLFNGWAQSRYGSRKIYMGAMAVMFGTIFILVFANSLGMLVAGNIVCGLPWGVFQTLTTVYAAEIAPVAMRGYLTSWVSMCWGTGSFLAAGVLRASLGLPGDWAWRVPYMLQWVWPIPLLVVGYFAPESPWYLVRKERYAEAEAALYRLARPGHYTPQQMKAQLAFMKYTDEKEKLEAAGASYADCFKGTNLRRTEIVCITFLMQAMCGQAICSYATVFLQAAGMAATQSFNYSMGIQSSNIVATGTAIYLMGRVNRRTFYLCGLGGIAVAMLVIGIIGVVPVSVATTGIAIAVMMIIINLAFKVSLGPACYTIIGETPNSRVRPQSIVLARTTYILGNIINGQVIPRQFSKTAWNWGAKVGWYWLGIDAVALVYTFFRIPETKDRTFLELDWLFFQRVPARKFAGYHVDLAEMRERDEQMKNDSEEKATVEQVEDVRR